MRLAEKIRLYYLAIKYWSQGDTWKQAVEFATKIVMWRY